MSTVTVRMKVRPEKHDDFLRILHNVTRAVETNEPGCFVYATWKTETPYEYLMVESYTSEDGRSFHEQQHAAVFEDFMSCLEGPPEVEVLGALEAGTCKQIT